MPELFRAAAENLDCHKAEFSCKASEKPGMPELFRAAAENLDYEIGGNSSVGRAQPCQGWGREFESRFPLKACRSEGSASSFQSIGVKSAARVAEW